MPRRPIGDHVMSPAERQRKRRRRLGLDGPTLRFAKAVQHALRHGLPEDQLLAMVTSGAMRFRDQGLVTETALAREMRDAGQVMPSGGTVVPPGPSSPAGEPLKRDNKTVTVKKAVKRDRPRVTVLAAAPPRRRPGP